MTERAYLYDESQDGVRDKDTRKEAQCVKLKLNIQLIALHSLNLGVLLVLLE